MCITKQKNLIKLCDVFFFFHSERCTKTSFYQTSWLQEFHIAKNSKLGSMDGWLGRCRQDYVEWHFWTAVIPHRIPPATKASLQIWICHHLPIRNWTRNLNKLLKLKLPPGGGEINLPLYWLLKVQMPGFPTISNKIKELSF